MSFIGPTRPWLYRSSDEDRAEAEREHTRRGEAHFNDPRTIEEEREVAESQLARLKAQTEPVESLESALYGKEHLSQPNVRYGSRARRRGMRTDEEAHS